MSKLTLREVQAVLLNIGKVFHRICIENGIPYYMLGGTMLGAVRHKGFIPWDDDMDFGVPREYFEKLKQLLEVQLPTNYRLLTMDNSKALISDFYKIEDTRTMVNEQFKENVATPYGINIDIFPIDECNGRKGIFSKNNLIQFLWRIQSYRFRSATSRSLPKKAIAYGLKGALFFFNERTIADFIKNHLMTGGGYWTNYYGAWGIREIVPAYVFGKPTLYDFEGNQFYGVQYYDAYLNSLYGDYMQLPPEEKRHIHLIDTYWK